MNVIFVISSLAAGGAQKVLSFLANHWAQRGWHVTILAFSGTSDVPFFPLDPSVRYVPLGLVGESSNIVEGAWNNVRRILRLRDAIRHHAPKVVIAFMDQENMLTTLAVQGLAVPVIVSVRIDPMLSPMGALWGLLRDQVYPLTDHVVVPTSRIGEAFSSRIQRKVTVIPNPVFPPDVIYPRQASITRTIIAVGRLTRQKGFDVLMHAFARLTDRYPDWRLNILGDGPLRAELERLRVELNLTELVKLQGESKNIHNHLAQADLFVLSSRYEGFPNALCEAMASGLAVVATDCRTGPREIIEDRVNGLLATPDDIASLAECMDRLMSDDVERKRLGASAKSISERFHPLKIAEMWDSLIRHVVHST
jgi:glycosyltransferase involved in cell wall biosynthesis